MELGTIPSRATDGRHTVPMHAVEMAANEDGTVHCYACTTDSDAVEFPVHAVEVAPPQPGRLGLLHVIVSCPRCAREGRMSVDHHEQVLARLLGIAHLQIRIAS